jgi:hypothetical protein
MARWVREYRYRRAMGGTHDDYMDTPEEIIEAMIRVHDAYQEAEARANKRASAPAPPGPSVPQIL